MIKIVITKQKVIKKLLSLFQTETEEITAQVVNWTNAHVTSLWHKQMMLMALLSINDTSIIMIMLFMTFLTCMLIHAVSFTHDNYSQIIQSDRSVPFSTDNKPFAFLQTNIHMYCLYTSHAILRVNWGSHLLYF